MLPAFYETWWFIAGCVAAAGAVGASIVQMQRRQLEARAAAVIEERTRLARELHDTLLQGFTGIALQIRAVRARYRTADPGAHGAAAPMLALDDLAGAAEATLSEARHAVWAMRAPVPAGLPVGAGLGDRLERAARDLVGATPVKLDFAVAGEPRPLPPDAAEELERIGREAVSNAVRHAAPARIAVSLVYLPDVVRLTVRDDGRGFAGSGEDAAAAAAGDGHFGLVGMRERAARLGARLAITSAPGAGTTVVVVLPRR
jgi:signal transduction histidine kinase